MRKIGFHTDLRNRRRVGGEVYLLICFPIKKFSTIKVMKKQQRNKKNKKKMAI